MNARKQIIEGNEVSEMHTFSLGGQDQKVLMEGKRKDLPIVIFLHGGPGTPIPFNAGCRGLFPRFTDRFLMVYWDQPGCGINNRELEDNLKISHFVSMAADLVKAVKELFPSNKLFLFATSWGSVLSAKLMETGAPIDGVLVFGQITHNLFFNTPLIQAVENSSMPQAKKERILQMEKQSLQPEDLQFLSRCLQKYTDAYSNRQGKKAPIGKILWGMLTSPDYSLRDFKAIVLNGYTQNKELFLSLFRELIQADLSLPLQNTPVPYHMIQGDTDLITNTLFVQDLVASAQNPNLTCEIVRNAGHYPNAHTMDRVLKSLTEMADRLA